MTSDFAQNTILFRWHKRFRSSRRTASSEPGPAKRIQEYSIPSLHRPHAISHARILRTQKRLDRKDFKHEVCESICHYTVGWYGILFTKIYYRMCTVCFLAGLWAPFLGGCLRNSTQSDFDSLALALILANLQSNYVKVLANDGGHLAVHPGNESIVYDRRGEDGYFDLWIMNTDGSNQRAFTITAPGFPTRHVGNPAWHPSGNFLVLQAQQQSCPDTDDLNNKAVPGSGLLNDIWIVSKDGSQAWRVRTLDDELGVDAAFALHPHFSHNGTRLIWSERITANGRSSFGEWLLMMGDVTDPAGGSPTLSNVRAHSPGVSSPVVPPARGAFYETHGFHPDDGSLLFSGEQDLGLEIYRFNIASETATRLTNAEEAWDEHAHDSPDGSSIAYISSSGLRYQSSPFLLETEFWLMNPDGSRPRRLSGFYDPGSDHYLDLPFLVPADSEWSPDGQTLYGLVITGHPDSLERGSGFIVSIDVSRAP